MHEEEKYRSRTLTLKASQISRDYERLKLAEPSAEKRLDASLGHYGQISPLVVGELRPGSYVLVDGFKRLRGLQRQADVEAAEIEVEALVLEGGSGSWKAAMLAAQLGQAHGQHHGGSAGAGLALPG